MKKVIINLLILISIICISTTVLAGDRAGDATALPPNAAFNGGPADLVCVQPGAPLRTKGRSYLELKELGEQTTWGGYNSEYHNFGTQSSCTNYTTGTSRAATPTEAYIAANSSGAKKQVAIWSNIGTVPEGRGWMSAGDRAGGISLASEAGAAAAFVAAGFSVEDLTDYQKVEYKSDNGKITLGPFKVSFSQGAAGGRKFSEVTGVELLYETKSGEHSIPVSALGGGIVPNTEFYVQYDPHVEGELITNAKIKINFRYLARS